MKTDKNVPTESNKQKTLEKNSSRKRKLWSVSLFIDRNNGEEIRARVSKLLRSPGIESARLGIDIWAPLKVYKYGLRIIPGKAEFNRRRAR
jgi:hypothetical protein